MNKTLFIIGIILFAGGIFFSTLPHDVHNKILGFATHGQVHDSSHDSDAHGSHGAHFNQGLVIAAIGLALALIGRYK